MKPDPSPRNRSLVLTEADRKRLLDSLGSGLPAPQAPVRDLVVRGNCLDLLPRLPPASIDLLVADPPYNLDLVFGSERGHKMGDTEYEAYCAAWLDAALPALKPGASVYAFGDWRGSSALYRALSSRLTVRNRIIWEREKGRAALRNWKSAHEEIWFATLGEDWYFAPEEVRLRKKVLAPYRDKEGRPKDWEAGPQGRYRDTAASNIWTDLTVPFWSMPENTDHPTQKPEKLLAKIILASCPPGGLVLDPFLGSGTSAVVARKLGRHFLGFELDLEYCLLALRRLELAATDGLIQGYEDGVFWERNSRLPRGC